MPDSDKEEMPVWVLPILSWLVSLYFLCAFLANAGFPPARELLASDALYALLWLFFLFLPFFKKVKVGGFLELEREIEKAKKELQEFKVDVRNNISVLSTNVNTIGRMSNQVTVNIPGISELREARKIVEAESPQKTKQSAEQLEEKILLQSEDATLALARTRIDIERLLRNILGKRTSIASERQSSIKFASIRSIFDIFISQNDQFAYLKKPFQYVMQVCNAAIHAQQVSDDQAQEALALGAQIIAVLRDVAGEVE